MKALLIAALLTPLPASAEGLTPAECADLIRLYETIRDAETEITRQVTEARQENRLTNDHFAAMMEPAMGWIYLGEAIAAACEN